MPFSPAERAILLAVRGVGPTVVARLEELGIGTLAQLAGQDAGAICAAMAARLGTTCWKNSPQARGAIASAIEAATAHEGKPVPLAVP